MAEEQALRAITLDAAEILGVADRVGSLEVGKDADIVVWSAPPLTLAGKPELVVSSGRAAEIGPDQKVAAWRN